MAKGIRTGIDFSSHEVTVTEGPGLLVHHIKKPNTSNDNIKFINTHGILAVTGDYGNWIFCREFHPSPEGGVSEGYWREKLEIASTQNPLEYDPEATQAQIEAELNGGLEEYGYTGKELVAMQEYLKRCLENVDDELDYLVAARNYPSFADHECMIQAKRCKYWLLAVFDGFDEICRRMKEGEITNPTNNPIV